MSLLAHAALAACPMCATGPAESGSSIALLGAMMGAPFVVALVAGLLVLRLWRGRGE